MAIKNVSLILVLIMTCLMAYATASYDLNDNMYKPGYNLEARLRASGSGKTTDCLKAIQVLNSCSDEIAEFFLNGRADIDHCCSAIDTVTSNCGSGGWPNTNMYTLPLFGYTYQETDILTNFCLNASPPAASPASA